MKEELQSKLVEILGSIQTAAGKAGDFAMTQLPEIAQSYVIYGRALSIVGVVFPLIVGAISLYFWRFSLKNKRLIDSGYYKGKTTEGWDFQFAVCVFFSVVSPCVAVAFFADNLLVWFAPKVWLLKEIAGLIK